MLPSSSAARNACKDDEKRRLYPTARTRSAAAQARTTARADRRSDASGFSTNRCAPADARATPASTRGGARSADERRLRARRYGLAQREEYAVDTGWKIARPARASQHEDLGIRFERADVGDVPPADTAETHNEHAHTSVPTRRSRRPAVRAASLLAATENRLRFGEALARYRILVELMHVFVALLRGLETATCLPAAEIRSFRPGA